MRKLLFNFLLIFFSSCFLSTWDARLVLINKTDKVIRYSWETKSPKDTIPDLTKCEQVVPYNISADTIKTLFSLNKWDVYFRNHPDHLLRIYIINEDSLSKYGTCEIYMRQIFMRRFDLTYNDLEKMKWQVIYDGK